MVIVGIGIIPAVPPLIAAGAESVNDVAFDAECRTGLPDIFAIGDCAAHSHAFADGATIWLRMPTTRQMSSRGDHRRPVDYYAVSWFWSNLYDLRRQAVDLSISFDEAIVRGDTGARSFSVVYLKDGRVIGLSCSTALTRPRTMFRIGNWSREGQT
ncbi:oxidoreductase C-terminal domain-containing protein [Sphingobium sp. V4]|uniref:oxidoreductase C-terminal domain-containing protein n=1 Tax=Sphingobium sp. V4 TaxID=3038927 RepID=UPI0025581584|nr:oxidoreductase C-terminal domain-containing protein [Sphingobium sp. V4]WIW89443.1 oxidoreductase C-terminal domain-containing protein [Sphingobium sp. V4]